MRVWHNLYSRIITLDRLFQAWNEFVKGKRKKADVANFQRFLEDNLFALYQELKDKTYKHGPYKSFYVRDPKIRHIHKAGVKDRIVHHLVSQVLEEIFDPIFYSHSYSCRKGKGTHKAVQAFIKLARKVSQNNTSPCYVLKCDIKKFFASVNHQILLKLLGIKIKDASFLWLLDEIIDSFSSELTKNPSFPKGMPIGNLTSQLFANIYLNPLDQFLKNELKIGAYIRYADDFVILSNDRLYLVNLIPKIKKFLGYKLKLSLHSRKIIIRDYYLGIDFLGYIIFPHFVLPRTKTKKRMFRKIYKRVQLVKKQKLPYDSLDQAVQSYLGYLSHANAFKLSEELKNQVWFWLTD